MGRKTTYAPILDLASTCHALHCPSFSLHLDRRLTQRLTPLAWRALHTSHPISSHPAATHTHSIVRLHPP